MIDLTAPQPAEERDALIEKIATAVARRGMETPAILFLEMHKPLTFVASQSLVVVSPFIAPFVGMDNMAAAAKLLESRENIELLIARIEEKVASRSSGSGHTGNTEDTHHAPR